MLTLFRASGKIRGTRWIRVWRHHMRLRLLIMVAAGIVLAADVKEEMQKEHQRFEGTWRFISLDAEGMKLGEEALMAYKLILKGKDFTMQAPEATYKGTYKVDVSKMPKTIDVMFTEGPEKGNTSLGIYELTDDTYKVCIGLTGKDRPTEFVSKPGSGHVIEILEREKP